MEWQSPSREPRPEPRTAEEITPQLDFLFRTESSFSVWLQFADAKAGGVFLLLGLGFLDLARRAKEFVHAYDDPSEWGWIASVGFFAAAVFAFLTIFQVARTLFPREKPSKPSLLFFGAVADYSEPAAYRRVVEELREQDMIETVSIQTWNLARIADEKYRNLRLAYLGVTVFLGCWAVARVGLGLV